MSQQYVGDEFGYSLAPSGFASHNDHLHAAPTDLTAQTILDSSDSNYINGFLDNPIEFNFDMDQKPQTPDAFSFGNNFSISSPANAFTHNSAALSHGQNNHAMHASNTPFALSGRNGVSHGPNQVTDAAHDDGFNAASTLVGLAGTHSHSNTPAMLSNSFSWGSLGLPNSSLMSNDMSRLSQNSPARESSGAFSMNPLYQGLNEQQRAQLIQSRLMSHPQFQHQASYSRHRHHSVGLDAGNYSEYHTGQLMSPSSRLHTPDQVRPLASTVRFGSDSSFGVSGYRGPGYGLDEHKQGNLMNVPLATEAATEVAGRVQEPRATTTADHRGYQHQGARNELHRMNSASSPGAIGNLSLGSPLSAIPPQNEPWKQLRTQGGVAEGSNDIHEDADPTYDETQPRKRRKGTKVREGDEEDGEYMPDSSNARSSAAKRASKVSRAGVAELGEDDRFTPSKTKTPAKRRSTTSRRATRSASADSSVDNTPSSAADNSAAKRKGRENGTRQNLTETQKRENHIQSEQKRRNIIKQGYADLSTIVPALGNGKSGLSKSDILSEVFRYIKDLCDGNAAMEQILGGSATVAEYQIDDGTAGWAEQY